METFTPEKSISTPFGGLEIKERKEFDAVDIRVINTGERSEAIHREKIKYNEDGEAYFTFQTKEYLLKDFFTKQEEKPAKPAAKKKVSKKAPAKKKTTKRKS